jgi:uncharacterized OsmC-like protein
MSRHPTASTASPLARPASEPRSTFSLSLHRYADFQQVVDFRLPGVAVLGVDERPPLGHGWGPSPAHVLGSALGACLGSALLMVMQGAGVEVLELRTDVSGAIQRDTLGQPHVMSISVRLTPVVASRADLDAIPSPERLAQRSMIADALRPDLGFWVAITPEVRDEVTPAPYGLPRAAPQGGLGTPAPHYVELATPSM